MTRSVVASVSALVVVLTALCNGAPADATRSSSRALSAVTGAGADPRPSASLASTAAVFAPRSDPGYAGPGGYTARLTGGSGGVQAYYPLATESGARMLWGDWFGSGEASPAIFDHGKWSFYRTAAGVQRAPDATLSLGGSGAVPVAGDWNGDGITDIGVVRQGVWHLAVHLHLDEVHASTPAIWRTIRFGAASAQPVAGDWDGRGADGIGVEQSGVWTLRQSVGAGPRKDRRFRFGFSARHPHAASDIATAGDWDGDGIATVGLVRGRAWALQNHSAAPTHVFVPRAANSWPSPMITVAGPSGTACPTARRTFIAPPATVVTSRILGGQVASGASATAANESMSPDDTSSLLRAYQDAQRYLLSTQYAAKWAPLNAAPYVNVLGLSTKSTELAVRPPAMSALAIAMALRTGAYDPARTGVSAQAAQAYVVRLVSSIACEHESVTPGGWGLITESAHWVMLTALAAWLVWDDLPAQTRGYVVQMLLTEANDQAHRPFDTRSDASGATEPGRAGNTAAEESAWNSNLLGLASVMVPQWHQVPEYQRMGVELDVSSYSTPSDVHSTDEVNGVPLDQRARGSNALADGTVVNHFRIHPDYMANISHLWWSADFAQLAGLPVPEAVFHHADLVYGALSTVDFKAGAPSASGLADHYYLSPGGVVYRGDGSLYYPESDDWGDGVIAPYVDLDAHAWLYGLDSTAAVPADTAYRQHLADQLDLVADSGASDGRTYSIDPAEASRQFNYAGREEFAAEELAMTWLARYLADHGTLSIDHSSYPLPTIRSTGPGPVARAMMSRRAAATP